MNDTKIRPDLIVEATHDEKYALWERHSSQSLVNQALDPNHEFTKRCRESGWFWEYDERMHMTPTDGAYVQRGEKPILVFVTLEKIRPVGQTKWTTVGYLECTSQLCDWELIDAWREKNYPNVPKTDVANCAGQIMERYREART